MRESRLGVALLLCSLFIGTAEAQQGASAIRGRSVDEQGGALPGVTIIVTHQSTGIFRQTVSSTDGSYSVEALTPGAYRVDGRARGLHEADV